MQRDTTFGAGSHVPAATLNSMQDKAVGLTKASGAPVGAQAAKGAIGARWSSPGAGVPNNQYGLVDASPGADWRNRTLWGWLLILENGDQVTGFSLAWQANDPTLPTVARVFGGRTNTGTGGLRAGAVDQVANGFPPSIEDGSFAVVIDEGAAAADRVWLYARPSDGALCLYNASGATLHAELLVFGTGVEPDPAAPPPDLIPTLTDVLWSPPTTAALRPATLESGPYLHRATDTGAITLWDGVAWRSFIPGAPASPVTTKTATYTAAPGDVILADAAGGAFTVNLPAAAGVTAAISVKKIDASGNAVTVDGAGSEAIDGAATLALATQYAAVTLWSDGTNWLVF